MAKPGAPVFTDDSGVRRVTMQLVARVLAGVLVLGGVALAVSLAIGVPLPGLERILPGPSQEHQATRKAPVTDTIARREVTQGGADGVTAGDPIARTKRVPAADRPSSARATTASRTQPFGATSAGTSGGTSNSSSSGGSSSRPTTAPPSATPSPSPDKPAGSPSSKPSAKPRNPKAATPTRGSSAFSNSRANRSTASADPTTAPGMSGASHGKSGTGFSG